MNDENRTLTQAQVDAYLDGGAQGCPRCLHTIIDAEDDYEPGRAPVQFRCMRCGFRFFTSRVIVGIVTLREDGGLMPEQRHSPAPDHAAALARALEAVLDWYNRERTVANLTVVDEQRKLWTQKAHAAIAAYTREETKP
jgi:hypothetical protein